MVPLWNAASSDNASSNNTSPPFVSTTRCINLDIASNARIEAVFLYPTSSRRQVLVTVFDFALLRTQLQLPT